MLFVVVARALGSLVVLSILVSTVTLLLPTGTLAPHYHLNKATSTTYALSGGRCTSGFYCGFAFVDASGVFSWSSWNAGAALSFK